MNPATAVRQAELVLANPFEDAAERERAASDIATLTPGAVEELARSGRDKEARRVAVALALVESSAGREPPLLKTRNRYTRQLSGIGLNVAAVDEITASAVRCTSALRNLAGVSPGMQRVRASAWRACFGESVYEAIRLRPLIREQNVLVLGETGTGKELVAQAIAAAGPELDRVQAVNAAAIPRDLLESELFGHVRGAFTGAHSDRQGKITAAHRGTLFLDEIADVPEELQVKLLRVIEENRLTPLGSNSETSVDVRYVCATSQPLEQRVDKGLFRVDLYQRLAGTVIQIPPLRERPEDLRPITDHLFRRYARRLGEPEKGDAGASTAHLSRLTAVQARFCAWLESEEGLRQTWPGNVRELQSQVRSWVLGFTPSKGQPVSSAASSRIEPGPLPPELSLFINAEGTLRELEDWYISHVFAKVAYKQRKAAKVLGMDRGTLARRLKQIEEM